ncbi:alpha/beta fold hydrolase [Euzebya rosea]|uniref:alpha/beta fold hydrolase n=1 Tax=Euzebya rosea TaxID=2052804 RepID=UPI0013005920|nr:alpha/beta hydrolase [Euzebya rosea]
MSDTAEPLGLVEVGEGPPLVAVHGAFSGGRLTFEGVARRWGRRSRVLVVDRPGFERSPGPEAPIGEQAARLLATIDQHADGGPVDALGTSFGGLVVLRAVQERPAAFRSLIIVETAAIDLTPSDMVEPSRLLRAARAAHERAGSELEAAFDELFEVVDPALMAALAPLYRRGDPGLAMLPGDLAIWLARLDRAALADAVSDDPPIPVTTVSGSTSHPAFRTFGACTAAALFGQHHVIDGAGHAAHLHPRFPDVLNAHLDALE